MKNDTGTGLHKDFVASSNNKTPASKYPKAARLSLKYFKSGLNCSESLLRAFNELYALGLPESAYGIATGFGSGMGEAGCACGAVTGAVAVLGLVSGRTKKNQSEQINHTAVKYLHDRFKEKHTVICCRALTRSVKWKSAQHKRLCQTNVIDAALIVDELLQTYLFDFLPGEGRKKAPVNNIFKSVFVRFCKKDSHERRATNECGLGDDFQK